MNTLKNIFYGVLVLSISFGIFALLEWPGDERNIESATLELASTINLLIDKVVEKLPIGEERDKVEQNRIELITKVEQNELSEEQYNQLAARLTNIRISPDTASADELQTFLRASIESQSDLHKINKTKLTDEKAKMLERRIHYVLEFGDEFDSIEDESVRADLSRRAIVTADSSDLHIIVDEELRQKSKFITHPDARHFIDQLPEQELVKFVNFQESQKIAQYALQNWAALLPQNVREQLINDPQMVISVSIDIDSLKNMLPEQPFDVEAWEESMIKLERVLEKMEEQK